MYLEIECIYCFLFNIVYCLCCNYCLFIGDYGDVCCSICFGEFNKVFVVDVVGEEGGIYLLMK